MAGGKSTPKKDRGIKVTAGEFVKAGTILARSNNFKAGRNVGGINALFALCDGKVYFTKKVLCQRKTHTFINILPS